MIMKVVTIHTKVSIRATCCSPGWTMILYTHRRCLEVALSGHADPFAPMSALEGKAAIPKPSRQVRL
jgi:hypothetical protein